MYKAYKDECYIFGICVDDPTILPLQRTQFFDGYLDLTPQEKKEFDKVDRAFWMWQRRLAGMYKEK